MPGYLSLVHRTPREFLTFGGRGTPTQPAHGFDSISFAMMEVARSFACNVAVVGGLSGCKTECRRAHVRNAALTSLASAASWVT